MRSRWLPSSSPLPNSSDRNELRLKYMRGFSTLLSGSETAKQGLGGQTLRAGATTDARRDPSGPRPHRPPMSRTTPTTQRQILSMSEWDRSMRDLGASSQDRRGGRGESGAAEVARIISAARGTSSPPVSAETGQPQGRTGEARPSGYCKTIGRSEMKPAGNRPVEQRRALQPYGSMRYLRL